MRSRSSPRCPRWPPVSARWTWARPFPMRPARPRRAVTPKTKALIVNSPHNPTGMVASDDELRGLAELAVQADLLVITDEVYEHLVFDGRRHIPLANYPGMSGRTVTISSAAKMF